MKLELTHLKTVGVNQNRRCPGAWPAGFAEKPNKNDDGGHFPIFFGSRPRLSRRFPIFFGG